MRTNTVQLHKKVKYLLDQTNSPRFRVDQIDEAINDAIDQIMFERFKPESPQDTQRGFQRNRILRDELRPLVKVLSTSTRVWEDPIVSNGTTPILFEKKYYYYISALGSLTVDEENNLKSIGAPVDAMTGDIVTDLEFEPVNEMAITIADTAFTVHRSKVFLKYDPSTRTLLSDYFPADYNYLALIRIKVSGVTADPFEITYEQVATVMQDPYSRPSIDMPPRTYHFEANDGYRFLTGDRGVITEVEFYYLSKPVRVKYGKEVPITQAAQGEIVILGQEQAVITYSGINKELSYGDEFSVPAGVAPSSTVIVKGTVNSDMPDSLVREICSRAAKILLVTVENFNKATQTT